MTGQRRRSGGEGVDGSGGGEEEIEMELEREGSEGEGFDEAKEQETWLSSFPLSVRLGGREDFSTSKYKAAAATISKPSKENYLLSLEYKWAAFY